MVPVKGHLIDIAGINAALLVSFPTLIGGFMKHFFTSIFQAGAERTMHGQD